MVGSEQEMTALALSLATASLQTTQDTQLGFHSSSCSEAGFRCMSTRFLISLLSRNLPPCLLRAHIPFSGLVPSGHSSSSTLSLGVPARFSASLGFCRRRLPGGLAAHAVPSGALGIMTRGQRKRVPSGDDAMCPKYGRSEGAGTEARPEPGVLGELKLSSLGFVL